MYAWQDDAACSKPCTIADGYRLGLKRGSALPMRADFVRRRKKHHLMSNRDSIADRNRSA
jgi:hypothetical protein